MGNHCINGQVTIKELATAYQHIHSLTSKKGYWLSHCPIHPMEMRNRVGCIHGHTHPYLMLKENMWGDKVIDTRYKNVCLEYTGYRPILLPYVMSDEYTQECIKLWNEKYSGVTGE